MNKENTLTLAMIVKDEEFHMERCLSSISDIVDEIIVVDTGSKDNTLALASNHFAKIYEYKWNDNFSEARNFALQKATSDWILILDADEALATESKKKLVNFINSSGLDGCNFTIRNYIDETYNNYTIHTAFRLLRNNGEYKYTGRIHEQIIRKDGQAIDSKFGLEDIIIYHYGYIKNVIDKKDKRNRNIPLILKSLEENPTDSFNLFNLGNEYLSKNEISNALSCYLKAIKFINNKQMYAPHLLYRTSVCYQLLKEYENSLKNINEALSLYSPNVDFEYLKGCVYLDWKKYTLAIESFKKCLELGDNNSKVKFINNCGSINPLNSLGDTYYVLEHYDKALYYYSKALELDSSQYSHLYKIGRILNKVAVNKNEVTENLCKYFGNINYLPNILVVTDILLKEKLYSEAKNFVEKLDSYDTNPLDRAFLSGKYYYYTKSFDKAYACFVDVLDIDKNLTCVIPNIISETFQYYFALCLIRSKDQLFKALDYFKEYTNLYNESVFTQIYNINMNISENHINENIDNKVSLSIIEGFLTKLLAVNEIDVFERQLTIYNYFDNKGVLLSLAKVYYNCGYKELAIKVIMRSIKELDYIDYDALDILYREIR